MLSGGAQGRGDAELADGEMAAYGCKRGVLRNAMAVGVMVRRNVRAEPGAGGYGGLGAADGARRGAGCGTYGKVPQETV